MEKNMKNNIYVYSFVLVCYICITGSFQGAQCKESVCNAGDAGAVCLIPGLGRSPGEENSSPFQYPCLEKSMARGAWWATVHGVMKNWTQLSAPTCFV